MNKLKVAVVGVCDVDAAQGHTVAREVGTEFVADHRALLGRVDAVTIAASTAAHFDLARFFLENGVHVLVEKPMTRTSAEGAVLTDLARTRGLKLQVGHVERFNPALVAARRTLDVVRFIECHRLASFKGRGADVNVILDLMIHDLDLAFSLARSEVTGVSACGFRVLTSEIDIASARLEFANGCVADLSASRVSQAVVRKFRVFEPGLYASADLQAGKLRYVRQEAGEIRETEETHTGGDALAAQAESFVLAITQNHPVAVDGEEGRRVLKVALEIGRLVRERLARFSS